MTGAFRRILRWAAAVAILAVGVGILAGVMLSTNNAGNKDYTCYWASGKLINSGRNPYDFAAVNELERQAGSWKSVVMMRNPPNAMWLGMLAGLMPLKPGAIVWCLATVGVVIFSIRLLWVMHGRVPDVHLFTYMFLPVLSCMETAQSITLVLAAAVIFLWINSPRSFSAGLCLAFMAMKPHLFVPFGVIILLWAIRARAWRVILGALVGTSAMVAIAMKADPQIWSQYLPVLRDANVDVYTIPFVSLAFTLLLRTPAGRFVPCMAGAIWAGWYFWKHRDGWDWRERGPLVLMVSIVVAPYWWLYDQAMFLPAIVSVLSVKRGFRSYLVINTIGLAVWLTGGTEPGFLFWTPVAWLCWYLINSFEMRTNRQAEAAARG